VRIVVANSMIHHQHAGGEYNKRRVSCEAGVAKLQTVLPGITELRDVSLAQLEAHKHLLDDLTYRRCRHVVTEDERVLEAETALRAGDVARFGDLMNQSHTSMRDDYEITCPEIDTMVEIAQKLPGVHGARMTGGGFGGCTVSLVEAGKVDAFIESLRTAYKAATGIDATIFACSPGNGVGTLAQ
jgi:galactokinase